METVTTELPASGDWLSWLKPVANENDRLDKLGKKETNGFRIGTRLVRKDASGNNVFGMVVQVVSKSDEANQYEYPWVWAAWMDTAPNDALTAGNDKTPGARPSIYEHAAAEPVAH